MDKASTPAKPIPTKWNRVGYIAFTVAGIIFTFWGSDRTQGPLFMALALIFDPYDQSVKWNERPRWMKGLLIVHLGLAAAMLGYVMGR
jgi:hypothetical protein